MEKLWKRGNYVKLFDIPVALEGFEECYQCAKSTERGKDDVISTELRGEADDHFDMWDYEDAMITYTSSLRYAENGSENVGLAYDRRAACHFIIGRFHEALVDIDLAIETYPPEMLRRLLPRLLRCRQTLLDRMNGSSQRQIEEYNLDFQPHKDFPCLANVVKLKYNEEIGRHFVANSDIPEDKIILKEECFAVTHKYNTNACYTCSRTVYNFIPCESCSLAIFCNTECKDKNKTHEMECGSIFAFYGLTGEDDVQKQYSSAKFDIQTIMNAIVTFGDVNTLMSFVKRTLLEDQDRPPTSMHNDEAKYGVYFKLKKFQTTYYMTRAAFSYVLAMKIPRIGELFDTMEKQRFLMHLVTHHTMVNSTNSFESEVCTFINNIMSFFNHSCDPNADTLLVGVSACSGTLRDISKGEEICISYLGKEDLKKSREHRQKKLLESWGFLCECSECQACCC